MDTHGDYSPLDRSRLLASGLDNGASGSGGSNGPGGGSVHPTVSELAGRAATPTAALSTLAAQYHSRFGLPSAMPGKLLLFFKKKSNRFYPLMSSQP